MYLCYTDFKPDADYQGGGCNISMRVWLTVSAAFSSTFTLLETMWHCFYHIISIYKVLVHYSDEKLTIGIATV